MVSGQGQLWFAEAMMTEGWTETYHKESHQDQQVVGETSNGQWRRDVGRANGDGDIFCVSFKVLDLFLLRTLLQKKKCTGVLEE